MLATFDEGGAYIITKTNLLSNYSQIDNKPFALRQTFTIKTRKLEEQRIISTHSAGKPKELFRLHIAGSFRKRGRLCERSY